MWTQQLQAESRPSVDHGWSSSRLILLTYEYVHVFECSGAGSSAPEHLRVRQQVTDDTVHWGRTHLSRIYHIPFRAGAGYSVVDLCVYIFGYLSDIRYGIRNDTEERSAVELIPLALPFLWTSDRSDPVSTRILSSRNPRNHPAGSAGPPYMQYAVPSAVGRRVRGTHGTTRRAGATCKSSQ